METKIKAAARRLAMISASCCGQEYWSSQQLQAVLLQRSKKRMQAEADKKHITMQYTYFHYVK